MKIFRTLTLLLAVFTLMACVGTAVDPDMPPDIAYGEEVCDRCGMVIESENFAASLVLDNGLNDYEYRLFDDISGMLLYTMEHGDLEIVRYYVHDFRTAEWLDAYDAYYVVRNGGLLSPTSFTIAACEKQLEAETLAKHWDGEVYTFAELHVVLFGSIAQSHHHAALPVVQY